jgi:hypothetical protein
MRSIIGPSKDYQRKDGGAEWDVEVEDPAPGRLRGYNATKSWATI